MRCPDPKCGATMPDEAWTVEELSTEVFRWFATCPGCRRPVAVHHGATDTTPVDPDPADWCCPTCGHPARVIAENRGPVAAALRCKDGCGALISLSRLVAR
jgi:hypothetical protein